jgi:hypothetical protein
MPLEFIQIPANGQGSAKEELNRLLRGGRIASVKKEFVSNGDDSLPPHLHDHSQLFSAPLSCIRPHSGERLTRILDQRRRVKAIEAGGRR